MRTNQTTLVLLLGILACRDRTDRDEVSREALLQRNVSASARVEYQELHVTEHAVFREVSLCELLHYYDAGAGLYRVTSLKGLFDGTHPRIDIELELIEPWSDSAPGNPVVRVLGGASDADGSTSTIDARVGEDIGVLLAGPDRDSAGAYRLFPLGVFHDRGRGYTNGQLFAVNPLQPGELGKVISAAARAVDSAACPDHLPEGRPEPVIDPRKDQVPGPEETGVPIDIPLINAGKINDDPSDVSVPTIGPPFAVESTDVNVQP